MRDRSRAVTSFRSYLVVAGVLSGVTLVAAPVASAAAHSSSAASAAVVVTVERVTPGTPVTPAKLDSNRSLVIEAALTNTTSETLTNVVLTGVRGDPIQSQQQLTTALKKPSSVDASGLPVAQTVKAHPVNLPPHGTVQTTFNTTTGLSDDHIHLCICDVAVYPFTVTATVSGTSTNLGHATTFIPVAYPAVRQTSVAWVWPLIDRPHRLDSETVFEDDDLSASVAAGGRLDRALAVVEQLPSTIPVTLLVDPETIAELQVMASGTYSYRSGTRTVAGTHGPDAASWLDRLRTALRTHPDDRVSLTPYADPDVQTMTAHGRSWRASMPPDMAQQVADAFGGTAPGSAIYEPAATRLSSATLDQLGATGVDTIVLPATAVRVKNAVPTEQTSVVSLTTKSGPVAAVVSDPSVQTPAIAALASGGGGARSLPTILSQLAIKAVPIADRSVARSTVIAAPRYVDADVQNAVDVIRSTSISTFTRPASVTGEAVTSRISGSLAPAGGAASGLPGGVFSTLSLIGESAGTLRSMLTIPGEPTGSPTQASGSSSASSSPSSNAPSTPPSSTGSTASASNSTVSGPATTGTPATGVGTGTGNSSSTGTSGSPSSASSLSGTTGRRPAASNTGAALLQSLPIAEQRLQSSAWRADSGADAKIGSAFASRVTGLIRTILSSVRIVPVSTGDYTLGSANSKVPVTVRNSLQYPINVTVQLRSDGNVPGFSSPPLTAVVPANSTKTYQLSTEIQRPGGYRVKAFLSAPDGAGIGAKPLSLTIHSTAFGRIGLIITIVAGGLLVLALVIRAIRTIRRQRKRRPPTPSLASST